MVHMKTPIVMVHSVKNTLWSIHFFMVHMLAIPYNIRSNHFMVHMVHMAYGPYNKSYGPYEVYLFYGPYTFMVHIHLVLWSISLLAFIIQGLSVLWSILQVLLFVIPYDIICYQLIACPYETVAMQNIIPYDSVS